MGNPALVASAIAALTAGVSDADEEAARTPPYPAPPAWHPFLTAARSALEAFTARGGSARVVDRDSVSTGFTVNQVVERLPATGAGHFGLHVWVAALLFTEVLSVDEVRRIIDKTPSEYSRSRMQEAIVNQLLSVGDFDGARTEADSEQLRDSSAAWRDIGWQLADDGDAKGFLAAWPKYGAVHEKVAVNRLRARLVSGVSRHGGWQAALEVAKNRRVGAAFAPEAFSALITTGGVAEIARILAVEDAAAGMSELQQLRVLVDVLIEASRGEPVQHSLLPEVVERLIAVDPVESKKVMRERDLLLWRLHYAIRDEATLKRVRGATRTPGYKSDMTTLRTE